MTVGVIGLGLIGGSMALVLKEQGYAQRILGADASETHQQEALQLGLVDEIVDVSILIQNSNVIVLATPVDAVGNLLPQVLDAVQGQVVLDVGSIKAKVVAAIEEHPGRGRFVATHPMWGTEYSGPRAAVRDAFRGKAVVLCDKEESDADAVQIVQQLYQSLGMKVVYMNSVDHDVHVAYVSHVSHITSFALANTVLEKEREEGAIFDLASGGFESTVRLAKSNAATWVPILMQNKENVLDVLNEHISQLRKFKACLEKENGGYLKELIEGANRIRRIIE